MTVLGEDRAPAGRWRVVVPAKSPARGKSRLGAGPEWARALLCDTVDAILGAPAVDAVLLVTDDAAAWGLPQTDRLRFVPDPGAGLNAAIGVGLAAAGPAGPVAIVLGDLPGLATPEFSALLDRAGDAAIVVRDHEGSGSTMTLAASAEAHAPRFGADSFRRHLDAGYRDAALPASSTLRWDVDNPEDVVGERLGPRTGALLASSRRPGPTTG